MRSNRLLGLLFALALPGVGAAQTPCEQVDFQLLGSEPWLKTPMPPAGSGANWHAYAFTSTDWSRVQAAAMFTASPDGDDYMRIELWDHDEATQQPGRRLSEGTMFSPASPSSPQGGMRRLATHFDRSVPLARGKTYWFVWVEAGGSLYPKSGGVNYRGATGASPTWGARATRGVKFGLFCDRLTTWVYPGSSQFGHPCQSSTGDHPSLLPDRLALGGVTLGIDATNLPVAAPVLLVLGLDPNAPSLFLPQLPPGCAVHTDYVAGLLGTTGSAPIGALPASPRPVAAGFLRFSLTIPTAIPPGTFLATQAFALDAGSSAAIPVVSTPALRLRTF